MTANNPHYFNSRLLRAGERSTNNRWVSRMIKCNTKSNFKESLCKIRLKYLTFYKTYNN
jgi:hypothetical protein